MEFNIDNILIELERDPRNREAAFLAFRIAYASKQSLTEQQITRINKIIDTAQKFKVEDTKNLAFVKLHLYGLLAIDSIHPGWPIIENPGIVTILEKALEASKLADLPDFDVEDPVGCGKKLSLDDSLGFSSILVTGIMQLELSLRLLEQRKYEEAIYLICNSAWNICATMKEDLPDISRIIEQQKPFSFKSYLPHSGQKFNIQGAVSIFEEIKKHTRDIRDWEHVKECCDVLRYLGYKGLYDVDQEIRYDNGNEYNANAIEYWGKAITFAEIRMNIMRSPIPIITRDAIERVETQERLNRDFLGNLWQEIKEDTMEILIDAEIEWIHHRADKMVNEIRKLLELELPIIFPFLAFTINLKDDHLVITRIKIALEKPPVEALIDSLDMNELPKFLQKVTHARNYFDKEQHLSNKISEKHRQMMEEAVSIHRELLGIGCVGVLPRLLQVKKEIVSKE